MRVGDEEEATASALSLALDLAVGPAVNAAMRESRAICTDERGANVSYDTIDVDAEDGVFFMAGGSGDAIVDAIVGPLLRIYSAS
jgi:hypothetical protein